MFCVYCGEPVVDVAARCRKCNRPVHPDVARRGAARPLSWSRSRAVLSLISLAAMILVVGLVTAFLALSDPSGTSVKRVTPVELLPSVVTLYLHDASAKMSGQGTGFIVREGGIGATAWHVLEKAQSAFVVTNTGQRFKVSKLLHVNISADVAVFAVDLRGHTSFNLRPLQLELDSGGVTPGDRVLTITSPRGLAQAISDGLVAAKREFKGQSLLQITAPVSPGSSGGPVFNEAGSVIAIVRGALPDGQNLNFAVPSAVLGQLLVELDKGAVATVPTWPQDLDQIEYERLYSAGVRAYHRADFGTAARLFAQASRHKPNEPTAHYSAGLAFDQLGDFESAATRFRRFLSLAPRSDADRTYAANWLRDLDARTLRVVGVAGSFDVSMTLHSSKDNGRLRLAGTAMIGKVRYGVSGWLDRASMVLFSDPSARLSQMWSWNGQSVDGFARGTWTVLTANGAVVEEPFIFQFQSGGSGR